MNSIRMMFGDDPPAPDPPAPEKTFSQDDVNRMMADNKRGLQSQVDGLKTQLKGFHTEREQFEKSVLDAAAAAGIDPDDFDDDGTYHGTVPDNTPAPGSGSPNPPEIQKIVDNLNDRWTRKMDVKVGAVTKELEQERVIRIKAEEKAKQKELDVILSTALSKADVVDLEGGRRYFMPQMIWDDDTERWLYLGKDGIKVEIPKGIEDELPSWLKKSYVGGGAGSRSSSGSSSGKSNVVDLQNRVKELEEKARKTGIAADIQAFSMAARELRAITKQAGGA